MDDMMIAADQLDKASQESAVERVIGFVQQFGEEHLNLACHAAFPLALTPDLLYRIWANFVPQAPWTAVADVLLSPLCRETGYELYEMEATVRNLLLKELKDDERFGQYRLNELADFLTGYAMQQIHSHDLDTRDLAQIQRWTALTYTQPNEAASQLAGAISDLVGQSVGESIKRESQVDLIRYASILEAYAEPLSEFEPLLIYARGMIDWVRGDLESAKAQFLKIPAQDRRLTVAGVTLSVPKWVPAKTSLHKPLDQSGHGSALIAESTLEQYFYYLRQIEDDDARAIQDRRAVFERELRTLLAHLERLSGQAIPAWEWPQESRDRRASQRIVRTDWLDNPFTARSCFVEARTYGDVYWLQVGYCQSGQTGPEIFASLRDEAWRPLATDHLLGSSSYLCKIAADKADELATQVLAAYLGEPPGALVSTLLAGGRATLYGSPAFPQTAVLLYPDAACEEWAGQTFLNDVAPRLELYRHKADRQLAWCEQNYPTLLEQERSLRDLLGQINRASPTDVTLAQRLVQLYWVFNGNLGALADRQTTIGISLDNLDVVLRELEPLAQNRLLSATRDGLRRHHKQLEVDLKYADQARQQAGAAVSALTARLGPERLADVQKVPADLDFQAALIERSEFIGAVAPLEAEMEALTHHPKSSQPVSYPRISAPPQVMLTDQDTSLLQHIYHPGYEQVLVEKEFGGGYGGARVLLILPVVVGGLRAARKVTKLGSALELRREQENYTQHVGEFLPFYAARVEKYYEQEEQAALNYIFVGGSALGQILELEEYYRRHTAKQVIETLNVLLEHELGQRWYSQSTPLNCFFADEYGRHLVEHLRLELRPASADALWPAGQPLATIPDYRPIPVGAISRQYATFRAGMLLSVEGLVVTQIKHDEIKLQDPDDQGAVVRVEFKWQRDAIQGLELGSHIGVRGQVVYNRRDRVEQIVRDAFSALSPEIGSESIQLPGVPGTYPNPLSIYPEILGRTLQGRRSYIHGDLHLRNVLVDEGGRGWLIDFARVEKRHNLFDFIKLETYVRLMGLAGGEITFSHDEYAQFEAALADASLQKASGATYPDNPQLAHAHDVILAIRRMAQNYIGPGSDLENEYLPALFLYCLAVLKYHEKKSAPSTRLIFVSACVLSRYVLGQVEEASEPPPTASDQRLETDSLRPPHPLGMAAEGKVQTSAWDLTAARQLITAAFNDEELTMLCFDHFRPVYDEFSAGMGKGQKIHRLLDYCERYARLETLLELVRRQNPAQYARFAGQR